MKVYVKLNKKYKRAFDEHFIANVDVYGTEFRLSDSAFVTSDTIEADLSVVDKNIIIKVIGIEVKVHSDNVYVIIEKVKIGEDYTIQGKTSWGHQVTLFADTESCKNMAEYHASLSKELKNSPVFIANITETSLMVLNPNQGLISSLGMCFPYESTEFKHYTSRFDPFCL